MRRRGLRPILASVAAGAFLLLLFASPAPAADEGGRLRQERSRLTELKAKAEKTAADLQETLAREKMTRSRVTSLRGRLERQRALIARIDAKLAALGKAQERTEAEVGVLAQEQKAVRTGLAAAVASVNAADRGRRARLPDPPREERLRDFARRVLLGEWALYRGIDEAREHKVSDLTGLTRQIRDSEKKMEKEQKRGDALRSREASERLRLAELEARKKDKEKEVKALRARIARMESLVRRIERRMKAREAAARRGAAPPPGPTHFKGLPGGMTPPVAGRLVSRFGRQVDPVFGVAVENRGVEIETASGAKVSAVAKGTVAFAGPVDGFGRVLILQHGSGLFSVYGKAESFAVKTGQPVSKGETVGRLPDSPSGHSVLYFELRAAGTAVDPASAIPLH